jgi:hypothetical protein
LRRVDRSRPPPAALSRLDKDKKTELQRAVAHFEADPPVKKAFNFQVYKADEVKRRLEALFHGKCAYCETFYAQSAPMDVEHYRPKGAVDEDKDHPGYWWLAMGWDNLLPSCIDCNRKRRQVTPISSSLIELNRESRSLSSAATMLSGKKDSFPIAPQGKRAMPKEASFALEKALLLDPCNHDPRDHLSFYIDPDNLISLVLPRAASGSAALEHLQAVGGDAAAQAEARALSVNGAVSIQVYGLNRLGLVQARTALLRRLEFLQTLIAELGTLADALEFPKPAADGAAPPVGARDLQVAEQLRRIQRRTLDEMRLMARPDAEFSELAVAWIRHFREKAGGDDPA